MHARSPSVELSSGTGTAEAAAPAVAPALCVAVAAARPALCWRPAVQHHRRPQLHRGVRKLGQCRGVCSVLKPLHGCPHP